MRAAPRGCLGEPACSSQGAQLLPSRSWPTHRYMLPSHATVTCYRYMLPLHAAVRDLADPPALLHGDLWMGNVGANAAEQPILYGSVTAVKPP